MSAPAPPSVIEAFAISGDRPLVPVTDPGDGTASFDLGFPPITQQPRISGGVPPTRPNTNGILYMLSAHLVYQIGGMRYLYDSTFSTKQTGYATGAVLGSSVGPHLRWMSLADNNTNNPDVTPTNWLPFAPDAQPLNVQTAAPSGSGDIALTTGVGFLDLTPASAATIVNITGAYDGQNLIVSNLHATNLLTLSDSGNMRLIPGGVSLAQYMSKRIVWSAALSKWLAT